MVIKVFKTERLEAQNPHIYSIMTWQMTNVAWWNYSECHLAKAEAAIHTSGWAHVSQYFEWTIVILQKKFLPVLAIELFCIWGLHNL